MKAVFFDAFGDEFGDTGFEKRDFTPSASNATNAVLEY